MASNSNHKGLEKPGKFKELWQKINMLSHNPPDRYLTVILGFLNLYITKAVMSEDRQSVFCISKEKEGGLLLWQK